VHTTATLVTPSPIDSTWDLVRGIMGIRLCTHNTASFMTKDHREDSLFATR
jgi:hypothetical protein